MFSLAIKNGIIMIFLILCTHVLIIKYLQPLRKSRPEPPMDQFISVTPDIPIKTSPSESVLEATNAQDDEELLKYIKSLETPPEEKIQSQQTDPKQDSSAFFNLNNTNDQSMFQNISGFDMNASFYSEYEKLI